MRKSPQLHLLKQLHFSSTDKKFVILSYKIFGLTTMLYHAVLYSWVYWKDKALVLDTARWGAEFNQEGRESV